MLRTLTVSIAVAAVFPPAVRGSDRTAEKPQAIGVPVRAVTFGNTHPVLGPAPWGGEAFYTSYYSTTGAELIACDAKTGRRQAMKLPAHGGYGMCLGKDGAIYVGGIDPGDLFRFDPATGKLRNCGGSSFGIQYLWDLAVAPDGQVYGAGYPGARLLGYDPAAGRAIDHGSMAPGEQYVRSVCTDRKGRAWCGIGTRARLVVFDPKSGEKRQILPEKFQDQSMIIRVLAAGRFVCAKVLFGGATLLFDAEEAVLVRELAPPQGETSWTPVAVDGGCFYLATDQSDLYRLDAESGKVDRVAAGVSPSVIVQGRDAHGISDEQYFVYDLREGRELHRVRLLDHGPGMAIFALAAGPDGKIYGSTYINQRLFRYDPATGVLEDMGKAVRRGGQIDSMCAGRNGRLYFGSYTNAVSSVYAPGRPWHLGTAAEDNPREIGPLGSGQYRTTCQVAGPDGKVYVGSVPDYRSAPVGALTAVDPNSGERRVMTDLVPGGSVFAVAADDRFVYGAGGGRFFVFDPKAQKKIWETELPAQALAAAPDGKIVGAAGDRLFRFDPAARSVARGPALPCGALASLTVTVAGRLYAINERAIVAVHADSLDATILAREGGRFLAADRQGSLYFARGETLHRFRP
jgi:outer membrane protein assembly factor BamB